ncbi:MAG: imidazole glycerol phosphate synthase subunit HisH [Stackebrandtia sp.]
MTPQVVVFDYGSGNLRSAARALERAGARATVSGDLGPAARADGLVIPGVGAFAACMDSIRASRVDRCIAERVAAEAPVLGICVGAQVFFEAGTEHGVRTEGLGLFRGEVTALRAERVPHMGWNTVEANGMELFDGLDAQERFYFVHSYAAHGAVPDAQVATCTYGEKFIAAIGRGTVSATQFHPEKSGEAGLTLLSHWVRSLT